MDLSTDLILDFIQKGGTISVLVIVLVGALRGWWVPGYLYKELQRERDAWRDIATRGLNVAELVSPITRRRDQP